MSWHTAARIPCQLVGGHARAHAAAADQHAALGFAIQHRAADGFGEVRIVGRIFVEGADVENFLAERAQQISHGDFQLKARVVRTDDNFHRRSLSQDFFYGRDNGFSGWKPNFFCSSFSGAEAPNVCMPIILPLEPT